MSLVASYLLRAAKLSAAFLCAFLLFGMVFMLNGKHAFAYQESLCTFYYAREFVSGVAMAPGGLARLASLWLAQFFWQPMAGVAIMAALLAAISVALGLVIARVGGKASLSPLGLLPALSLAFLNYNVNYDNAGTVAFFCSLVLLCLVLRVRNLMLRLVLSLFLTVFLSIACGAVAMLFGVVLCLIALSENSKFAAFFILCPVLAYSLGLVYVHLGYYGDVWQAVLPKSYFTLRLKASGFVNIPWILTLVVVAVACAARHWGLHGRKACVAVASVCFLAAVAYAVVGGIVSVDKSNEAFKELCCLIDNRDWDGVVAKCEKLPKNSLVFQNCLNMALAEKGELGDRLFDQPVIDIRSVYIEGEKTPYMQALLSDVYYSMGHMALAQRNAFEANESLGNYSPRLIKRLAHTNLAFGHFAAAKKYIDLLACTSHYKAEADRLRPLLSGPQAVAADPELGPKAMCVFPDNRFSAYKGLDDDLKQILRANPDYEPARQYLCSLYLLSKNTPAFEAAVSEFYGPERLPRVFGQAMLAYHSSDPDSVIARYSIPAETIEDLRQFGQSPSSRPRTYWHFFNFTK